MSIMYCEKHDRRWDSDKLESCPLCEESAPQVEPVPIACIDCGNPYSNFPLDSTLPDEQWRMIHDSEGGLLCANCMVARAAKLPGAIAVRMRIEFAPQVETRREVMLQQVHDEVQMYLAHPAHQVYFRAGLIACREYMARFVEAQDPTIAASIRANWWPDLGQDMGAPRLMEWGELTEGKYGEPEFRCKEPAEFSPTLEALPIALGFLNGHMTSTQVELPRTQGPVSGPLRDAFQARPDASLPPATADHPVSETAPTLRADVLREGIGARDKLRTFLVPEDLRDALNLVEQIERQYHAACEKLVVERQRSEDLEIQLRGTEGKMFDRDMVHTQAMHILEAKDGDHLISSCYLMKHRVEAANAKLEAERKAREEAEQERGILQICIATGMEPPTRVWTSDSVYKAAKRAVTVNQRAESAERENAELRKHAEAMARADWYGYEQWKAKQEQPHD